MNEVRDYATPLGSAASGRLEYFGAIGGETRLESLGYAGATDRYGITITGGASNVAVDSR